MILPIIFIVIGVLLLAAAIVFRAKLGRTWMISVIAAGIVAAVCGGIFTASHISHNRARRESVYLSLCYLSSWQPEAAAFHLEQAEPAKDCTTAFTRSLLESMRGNELTARLNFDIGKSLAKSEDDKMLAAAVSGLDIYDSTQFELINKKLRESLDLSEKATAALELIARAESGNLSLEEAQAAGLSETEVLRLQIGAQLGYRDYYGAVSTAVALVEADPSAENRLLLAETVAESAYHGIILDEDIFAKPEGSNGSAAKERSAIADKILKMQDELASLELVIAGTTDEESAKELGAQKIQLTEELEALQRRHDKLFVYRAFSAIADIRSLEARLVRARLHFAVDDYDKATDVLLDSAGSLSAGFAKDERLKNALQVVENAYESEGKFSDTQEFRSAVTYLLSAPFSDLMHIRQSELTQAMTGRVIGDQKSYGTGLTISSVDSSEFPLIRVTVTGREDVLREIVEKKEIITRDTHQVVKYVATINESVISDVCVVVDQSGSMNGQPIADLKEALKEFVKEKKEGVSIAMVGFENNYEILNPLTTDEVTLLNTINNLYANGGTDITSGIRGGIEALTAAQGSKTMLLMTDGQSGIDESVVAEAAAMGIVIHTIGFGDVNHELLEYIAEQTGGQYMRADTSAELGNIYSTIQQIVGNIVVIEYTVENSETVEQRYFFLDAGDISIRREYIIGGSGAVSAPELYEAWPAIISPDDLQFWVDNGGEYSLTIYGENLYNIASVSVGGVEATWFEANGTNLHINIPPQLQEGWQSVEITLADGNSFICEKLIYVGYSQYYSELRLGDITFSGQGVIVDDGRLLMCEPDIYSADEDSPAQVSLFVAGTVLLPWPAGETETSYVDLGDSGRVEGHGVLSVNYYDSAYNDFGPDKIVSGDFTIECSPTGSRIIGEGGAVK